MAIGASWGPSAGGTGTWDQSSTGGVMPPFSGLTRIAAGSLRESQLLPSQAATEVAKKTPTETSAAQLLGRPAAGIRSEAIPCLCQNPTGWPTNRQKVLRC